MVAAGVSGCSGGAPTDGFGVGDCLNLGGTVEQPTIVKQACGGPKSNFRVFATAGSDEQCPRDADSSFSSKGGFGRKTRALCLDIDWVVGGCMSVPEQGDGDPVRVRCDDRGAQNKKRALQVLNGVSSVDECPSALGYPYVDRNFTVCVEELP